MATHSNIPVGIKPTDRGDWQATVRARMHAKRCPTLCNPMNCSPPGSSVHGILQARILEQVAIPSSRGLSGTRDRTMSLTSQAFSLTLAPPGRPRATVQGGPKEGRLSN